MKKLLKQVKTCYAVNRKSSRPIQVKCDILIVEPAFQPFGKKISSSSIHFCYLYLRNAQSSIVLVLFDGI